MIVTLMLTADLRIFEAREASLSLHAIGGSLAHERHSVALLSD